MAENLKFMVVSGFLGAGKTTTMAALTKHLSESWGKTAIIANDLGAKNLVDAATTAACGCDVEEITGDCICYINETLTERLDRMHAAGNKFVMSDIPGCGIGALEHVYYQLDDRYGDKYDLAPFTVVVDPERLRMILPEQANINLPLEDCQFLLDAQLKEADCIALNKCDTIDQATTDADVAFLKEHYPNIPVFTISALDGTGIPELAEHLVSTKARLERFDIGYGTAPFVAAEKKMSWYNRRAFFKSKDGSAFDANEVIETLIEKIRAGLKKADRNVPHLKIFAFGEEGEYAKASLLGVDYDIEWNNKLASTYTKVSTIINARAVCESETMAEIVDDAIDATCEKFNLKEHCFFIESFGMMDEGRKASDGGRAVRID